MRWLSSTRRAKSSLRPSNPSRSTHPSLNQAQPCLLIRTARGQRQAQSPKWAKVLSRLLEGPPLDCSQTMAATMLARRRTHSLSQRKCKGSKNWRGSISTTKTHSEWAWIKQNSFRLSRTLRIKTSSFSRISNKMKPNWKPWSSDQLTVSRRMKDSSRHCRKTTLTTKD